MIAAELVERVALKAIPGSSHEECCRIARAAIAETLAAIQPLLLEPEMIDALAAEIREQSK